MGVHTTTVAVAIGKLSDSVLSRTVAVPPGEHPVSSFGGGTTTVELLGQDFARGPVTWSRTDRLEGTRLVALTVVFPPIFMEFAVTLSWPWGVGVGVGVGVHTSTVVLAISKPSDSALSRTVAAPPGEHPVRSLGGQITRIDPLGHETARGPETWSRTPKPEGTRLDTLTVVFAPMSMELGLAVKRPWGTGVGVGVGVHTTTVAVSIEKLSASVLSCTVAVPPGEHPVSSFEGGTTTVELLGQDFARGPVTWSRTGRFGGTRLVALTVVFPPIPMELAVTLSRPWGVSVGVGTAHTGMKIVSSTVLPAMSLTSPVPGWQPMRTTDALTVLPMDSGSTHPRYPRGPECWKRTVVPDETSYASTVVVDPTGMPEGVALSLPLGTGVGVSGSGVCVGVGDGGGAVVGVGVGGGGADEIGMDISAICSEPALSLTFPVPS